MIYFVISKKLLKFLKKQKDVLKFEIEKNIDIPVSQELLCYSKYFIIMGETAPNAVLEKAIEGSAKLEILYILKLLVYFANIIIR